MGGDAVKAAVRECADGIDAIQEAERVGSSCVGVEHLFAATLLDPVARRLFLAAGGDVIAVQRALGRPVRVGTRGADAGLPRSTAMVFTVAALESLNRLLEHLSNDGELTWRISTSGWREPFARSMLRRRLLHDLLTRDDDAELPGLPTTSGAPTAERRQLAVQLLQPPRTPPNTLRADP